MTPRIGVNALYLIPGGVGGTEIYLRNLLQAWQKLNTSHHFTVFANRETGDGLTPRDPRFETIVEPVNARSRPIRIAWEQTAFPLHLSRAGVDVLFNPGYTSPLFARCPAVTVFHDMQHKRHPEYFRWFDLPFWRLFLYQSARSSNLLIADSQASAADLATYYPFSKLKTEVIPLGVGPEFFAIAEQRRSRTPSALLLCPSTSHPHKNLPRLVRAFSDFHRVHPEYRLIITGVRGFAAGALEKAIRESTAKGAVELPGWLPREELLNLYREAAVLVYPSTFEGFGLPVLEGLASGIPVVCSDIPVLNEIAGATAITFDPESDQALSAALNAAIDSSERLSAAGPLQASQFTWEQTATLTLAALERCYRSKSSS